MRLKIKYTIWIILLHTFLAVSCFYSIQNLEKPWLLLILEILVIISLGLSLWFYHKFRLPQQFIKFNKQALLEDDFNMTFIKSDNPQLNELYDIFNTMLHRIRRERKYVEEQQYFLKDVIDVSPAGIVLLDYDDKIELINPKARKLLHLSDHDIGKSWSNSNSILPNLDLNTTEPIVIGLSGSEKLRYTVNSFYFRGFTRKMVMINDLKLEILDAEKKSYSKVIRMMAHEINNSIGPINSILHTIKQENDKDQMLIETLDAAIHRTEALNVFMQNFASVVRLPTPILELKQICPSINNALELLKTVIKNNHIEIIEDLGNCPSLLIDDYQMEQVLINIIKNSIDAIGKDGTIKVILTSNSLIIKDNGSGIKPDHKDQLFTPFYTTKPTGQGIGLTITKHILYNHGFDFSLKTINDWTVFEIVFEN